MPSPCESCHAGCCRSFAVPISGADILAIERRLKLDFWDFACRWADPNGSIARGCAPHFFFPDEPQTPFVICLAHTESVFLPGTTKCRFLMESPADDGAPIGQARCGIYGSRPAACRAFPAKFNSTGDLAVIYDVPSRGRAGDHPAYDLCPRQWEADDLDPVQTVQDLAVAKYEMTLFTKIADVWNRAPRSWTIFPDFLRLVYARRVIRGEARSTLPFAPPADAQAAAPVRRAA